MLPKHSHLPPGSHKCNKKCIVCKHHLINTKIIKSDNTKETFTLRTGMSCRTENLIYVLSCRKCPKKQYIGETQQTLYHRALGHRSDINLNLKNKCPHIIKHFNSPDHSKEDMMITPLEKILTDNRNIRKDREKFWISKFQTKHPLGLNEEE